MTDCDAIVQGAGPAGLAAAIALAREGMAVAVLDDRDPARPAAPPGHATVDRASERILTRLGAWPGLARRAACPFPSLQIEEPRTATTLRLEASELGEPHLGHVVERSLLEEALREVLAILPGTRLLAPARIRAYTATEQGVQARLEDGRTLSAALLIGAEGCGAEIRRLAGIGWARAPYGQAAVQAHLRPERPHGGIARQRLLAEGPLALLPLADGGCWLVWPVARPLAERIVAEGAAALERRLAAASGGSLGRLEAGEPWAAGPGLVRAAAGRYIGERVALLGDAARALHPLAGQGLNLALLDAATLAEAVLEARRRGRDPGNAAALRRFERTRRAASWLPSSAVDGLHLLAGHHLPMLGLLRGLGLHGVAQLPAARRAWLRQAMGLTGELPALARGPEE